MTTIKKVLFTAVLGGCVLALGAQCQTDQPRDQNQLTGLSQNPVAAHAPAWNFNGSVWQAGPTAKDCSGSPIQQSPTDISLVTSMLYPGQTRGGDYKPHGGFRFDQSTNSDITAVAPFDAVLFEGSRYTVNGELQYTLDFISPCGYMYRVGHLLTLTPEFQAMVEKFPPAKEMDSHTTWVEPTVEVKAGTVLATAVGVTQGHNTFFDFGVYDLHQKNAASQDPAWAAQHADDLELAPYGVCWFDLLPAADSATVKSLPPADADSGKTSDYCK